MKTKWVKNWLDSWAPIAVVNEPYAMWRLVTSGILQPPVLGLVLLNILIRDLEKVTENCLLIQFSDKKKLRGAAEMLEGRTAIQRNLDRLEEWATKNIVKFNKDKCQSPALCWINPLHSSWLGTPGCRAALGN